MKIPRDEYPRPDFVREDWTSLNGEWSFAFDDYDAGHSQHWENGFESELTIVVPFAFQTKLSGIGDTSFHDRMWYSRKFGDPRKKNLSDRVILNFEGVDYIAEVYVNGRLAVTHTGSSTRFSADITDFIKPSDNLLVVFALDPSRDTDIPRGKQYWHEQSASIWYNRTSGIWKSVWMETVDPHYIQRAIIRPDIDRGSIDIDLKVSKPSAWAKAILTDADGDVVATSIVSLGGELHRLSLQAFGFPGVEEPHLWSPESPYLYGLTLQLLDERMEILDSVQTYVGMRSIECRGGYVYLNHKPYFQKLVLDQGYWPESLLTPPSKEALEFDIKASKEMGFNGCRKHQKTEDPWFYYLADKLGYLVWCDLVSPASFSHDVIGRVADEFREMVDQLINHPSIVAWVPFNESWGISQVGFDKQQQALSSSMYFMAKALDPTRLAVSNDGWEHTFSDMVTIHNYMHGSDPDGALAKDFAEAMSNREICVSEEPAGRRIFASGHSYSGQPIVISEFGGINYEPEEADREKGSWGYTSVKDENSYIRDLKRIFKAIGDGRVACGYCYTQLTDVEQEQNGLLTYDRKFKLKPELIREINDSIGSLPPREEEN